MAALSAALGATAASAPLQDELSRLVFMNEGTVRKGDVFVYEVQEVSYNEPDNVTCSNCGWGAPGSTHPWHYLWQKVGPSSSSYSPNVTAPPTGMRSSPALGGVSTGSTELRGDGSFREWTIFNQGPAGSGKYGIVDDVWMAARIGSAAKMLRTTPPPYAASAAVDSLTFSGTYPVTRLAVGDEALAAAELSVYGYSTLKPTSLADSAYPAVVLTLDVHNPGTAALDASFMLNLPFGAWTDCARQGEAFHVVPASDHVGCMKACATNATCASWQFTTSAVCQLNDDVPLTHHQTGGFCGVRSKDGWQLARGGGLTRSTRPEPSGPSMGDITLRAVVGDGVTASYASGDCPASLYETFAARGGFPDGSVGSADAASGAVAVSASVPAGGRATLSIVFTWYFPDRDFSGQILGNGYAALWPDSAAVAAALASEAKLASVVADLNAHHHAVASPQNPMPVWLKDMLVNQWSHFHMLMWYRDGRLREYEAWSCDDVDSVHNDYQRHLLYLWAFPQFELSKVEAWSTFARNADGSIWESLGYTGKPMDVGGGRMMGDTTSLYLLELYEIYRHSGNASFLRAHWGAARNASAWMIANAAKGGVGLPQYLQTTYDHFGFDRRQVVAYNAHIYLTALRAVQAMATVVGDQRVLGASRDAYELGQRQLVAPISAGGLLWNSSKAFWHAHSETSSQVFTDTLYGQMLGHHFFSDFTAPRAALASHLAHEWDRNEDAFGMRVLNDPVQVRGAPACPAPPLSPGRGRPPLSPQVERPEALGRGAEPPAPSAPSGGPSRSERRRRTASG